MALNIINHGGGKSIAQTPVITLTAYHANDCVGGLMTFDNAVRYVGGRGKINSLRIIDNDNEKAQMELWLFSDLVTPAANHAAMTFSDADMQKWVGTIPIAAADYKTLVDNAGACYLNVGFEFTCIGLALYGQLRCIATPTYTAVNDLTVKIEVEYLDDDVI
jgi:hypothetical protein